MNVFEQLPIDLQLCEIEVKDFPGLRIAAVFYSNGSVFVTSLTGLTLKASEIIAWEIKII